MSAVSKVIGLIPISKRDWFMTDPEPFMHLIPVALRPLVREELAPTPENTVVGSMDYDSED